MKQSTLDAFVPSTDCMVLLSGTFVFISFGVEETDRSTLYLLSYVRFSIGLISG